MLRVVQLAEELELLYIAGEIQSDAATLENNLANGYEVNYTLKIQLSNTSLISLP